MARRRRYSGGYGSGYQDPEDSMAQGGAFYNPYSPGIDWGMGIRNTLQNLAGVMEKRRQEKTEREQQDFENKIAEREVSIREKQIDAQVKNWLNTEPSRPNEWEVQLSAAKKLFEEGKLGETEWNYYQMNHSLPTPAKAEKQDKPDVFDKKLAGLDKLLKSGKITQAQYDAAKVAAYGVDAPTSPDPLKLVPGRNENDKFVRQWLNSFKDKDGKVSASKRIEVAKGMFKVAGAEPVSTEGFRLDMPATYNVAKKNIDDGLDQDGAGSETVKKYDAMFDYFKREILPKYKNFNDYIKNSPNSNNSRIDKLAIRDWFEVYK